MKYPLKNILYEKLKQRKNILDIDLLSELKKEDPEITTRDLSKELMQLEIMGLVSVSWVRKDARRVEIIEKTER
ncbi:MAG: hypothetical protein L6N95_02285 [Candidatus Methylarchaceae archaeon HK01B]|nr:hypothetical protein [Candidatus Methylarchaceae archaeon HK01M]MCP8312413.1 hypothetical protein [Candidatus Methylarchaceae archaeon HK02M1]MCP8318642.1 hypothetical protein [Candidatus Methylarchaceae archaeon HK01B]